MASSQISQRDGSALPWILEHILAYPNTYEIPLRTMYTHNVLAQSNRADTPTLSSSSSNDTSPILPATSQFPGENNRQSATSTTATEHFKTCLMEQISYLPSQPFSLPVKFITSFVRRVFTEDLCLVDFTQALTALDYLRDLDGRRKRELSAALRRLGIDKATLSRDRDAFKKEVSGVTEWASNMEDKVRKVEALYTQAYIGLRRWTLINEMRLEPFNKANCVAMLNTLYPPSLASAPTAMLTPTILNAQRDAFFRYIQAVEKNGRNVLINLEHQSRRTQDSNGWPVVQEIVEKYLRAANAVVDECLTVKCSDDFEVKCSNRRADSGVSFGSHDRPSSSKGNNVAFVDDKGANKPLPAAPCLPTPKKSESALERITRELRRIRSKGHESKENEESTHSLSFGERRSLKKMKSTGALGRSTSSNSRKDGKHSRGGSGDRAGLFEIDEKQRERLIAEAKRGKENRIPRESHDRKRIHLAG